MCHTLFTDEELRGLRAGILPHDMAEDGWRVLPDPEIAGSPIFAHDDAHGNLIIVAQVEENGLWSVGWLAKSDEHILAHEVDAESLDDPGLGAPLGQALELAGSYL